jgi:hypothetical protein
VFAEEECAVEVDLHGAPPLRKRKCGDRRQWKVINGSCHEHVEPAELRQGSRDCSLGGALFRDVGTNHCNPGACFPKRRCGSAACAGVKLDAEHGCAFLRKQSSNSSSDTATGTSNNCRFTLQTPHIFPLSSSRVLSKHDAIDGRNSAPGMAMIRIARSSEIKRQDLT